MNKFSVVLLSLAFLASSPAAAAWEESVSAQAVDALAPLRAFKPSAAMLVADGTRQPQALKALLDLVSRKAQAVASPVVIFDLDDTLIDTAYRQMSIIREFAGQPDVRSRFPDAAAKLAAVDYANVHYELADTFKALGVADVPEILPEFTRFWADRFFRNDYLMLDRANAGGVDFVREVLRRGGRVVYLTGRWEEMRPGTEGSMRAMGYPEADGRSVFLMLKPLRSQTDIDFKKVAFEDIARLGEVVGGFENEPANVNAYQQRFQTGIYIFLDTRHSNTQAVPLPSIFWVGDFRY